MKNSFNICFALCLLFYLLLFLFSYQLPLFYDNILFSSKIPDHFFRNGFFALPLPVSIDTGYGPLWAWYITAGWQILGKSLWVNHLLCLPILIASAWFYLKVAAYFISNSYLWVAMLLLWLEPTYLAQSTMASPDVLVVMGFIGSLYSIIYDKKYLLILLTIILAMLSVRGAILVFLLFINQLIFNYHQHQKIQLKLILPYLFSAAFFILWAVLHYQQTGYLLIREGSPWAAHHKLASISQMLNNVKFVVWLVLDFGRVILFGFIFFMLFFVIWKRKTIQLKTKILLYWCVCPLALLGFILCLRTNPLMHRYFMVCFLLTSILAVHLFSNHLTKKKNFFIFAIVVVSLISGHFWIYPDRITQGWDASLAHIPYFKLRKEMMDFLDDTNINYNLVATGFPIYNSSYYTNFSNNKNQFALHQRKFNQSTYLLYSNVCNDFSVEEIALLKSEKFVLQKSLVKRGVKMQLYKRR